MVSGGRKEPEECVVRQRFGNSGASLPRRDAHNVDTMYIVHSVQHVSVEALRRVLMLVSIRYRNAIYYSCELIKMHQVVDLLSRITQPQRTAISTPSIFSSSHTDTGYSEICQNYRRKVSHQADIFSNRKKVSPMLDIIFDDDMVLNQCIPGHRLSFVLWRLAIPFPCLPLPWPWIGAISGPMLVASPTEELAPWDSLRAATFQGSIDLIQV